jgi:gas vesicle protein
MADHDNVPYIVIERQSGGVSPFLWGLLLGAGAALLLAPRSGEETQEEIRQRARRIRTAAEDRVGSVRGSVSETINRTRSQLQDRLETVRETVDTRTQRAREVIDSGRRVATDARSELRRRVEEAREDVHAATASHRDDSMRGQRPAAPPAPSADVVVTDVEVEEAEGRPGLG